MKTLQDICLDCVGDNLHAIPRASRYLAPVHKELLLERMVFHDKLSQPRYLPHVTYNLFSPLLRRVTLYKSDLVTDAILKILAQVGCKLEHLCIHGCTQITDRGILHVTQGQDELQCLELRKLTQLTSKGVKNICSPHLEKLDFRGCTKLESAGIQHVLSRNCHIKELTLVACTKVDNNLFPAIAQHLGGSLENLDLASIHVLNDASLQTIATTCTNLSRFVIHGCSRITQDGILQVLENCPRLVHLDLSYCHNLQQSPSCESLMSLPVGLQELSLCGIILEDPKFLVRVVTRLSRLKLVRLCGVPALTDESMEEIMAAIGSHIEHVDLSGSVMSPLTDVGLEAISRHCDKVKVLALSLLKNVTGVTLLPLLRDPRRSANLTALLISCRMLSPEVLEVIPINCHNLEKLDVSGLNIVQDDLLVSLAENCPKLTYIWLKGCRNVTDTGVSELARCCPLTVVSLSGLNCLTDRCVFSLANHCPYLEEIYLNGCARITRTALRHLLDVCIPRVFISHRVPNADPEQLMAMNLDTGEYTRADLSTARPRTNRIFHR